VLENINVDNYSVMSPALAESSSIQETARKKAIRSKILSVVLYIMLQLHNLILNYYL